MKLAAGLFADVTLSIPEFESRRGKSKSEAEEAERIFQAPRVLDGVFLGLLFVRARERTKQ